MKALWDSLQGIREWLYAETTRDGSDTAHKCDVTLLPDEPDYVLVEPADPGTQSEDGIKAPRQQALDRLPTRILLQIAAAIPLAECKVSLALVCRKTFAVLGQDLLLKNEKQKLELLQRLARDGACKGMILCSCCLKFHSPEDPQVQALHVRPCTSREAARQSFRSLLPEWLHLNQVQALSRCHRFSWDDCRPDMKQYNQSYLLIRNTPKQYMRSEGPRGDNRAGVAMSYNVRISDDGRVLLRDTKVLWIPTDMPRLRIYVYWHSLLAAWTCRSACRHDAGQWRWRGFGFIFSRQGLAKSWTRTGQGMSACLWTHPQPCPQRCLEGRIGVVRGCAECQTDFACQVLEVEGTRFVFLTCWKDLGNGDDPYSPSWTRHHDGKDVLGLHASPSQTRWWQQFQDNPKYKPEPGTVLMAFDNAHLGSETLGQEVEGHTPPAYAPETCRTQLASLPRDWFECDPGDTNISCGPEGRERKTGWLQPLSDVFEYIEEVLINH